MWRIVSSERYSVSLHEVETKWSMLDCEDAHDTLDMLEEAAALANRPKGKPAR